MKSSPKAMRPSGRQRREARGLRRVPFDLERGLHDAVRAEALRRNVTIQSLVSLALAQVVAAPDRFPVPPPRRAGRLPKGDAMT